MIESGQRSSFLKEKLFEISAEHKIDSRLEILKFLKGEIAAFQESAKKDLEQSNDGEACARAFSQFQDDLISAIHHFICQKTFQPDELSLVETGNGADCLTIIATGGYGRGLLAPQSDIDLLFLLPTTVSDEQRNILEYGLLLLWDLGFKVGHAARTIKESIIEARADMTICTAMLDSRFLCGDEATFERYMTKFIHDVVRGKAPAFVTAKFEERDDRHERSGDTRYQVEPNLKEDKGGMRDLHLLHWLSTYVNFDDTIDKDMEDEDCIVTLVNKTEQKAIQKCEQFLWTTRCHLHFLRQKPDERLSFDVQLKMADLMGYSDGMKGMAGAEKFMRAYFLNAREIGDLTRIICSALEIRHLKAEPILKRVFSKLKKLSKSKKSAEEENSLVLPEGFVFEHGRLNVTSKKVFIENPVNLIRIFSIAVKSGFYFHPRAYRLVRESLDSIDDGLRINKEANKLFLEILMSEKFVETTLRRMTDSGVLGRFIPDFGTIDCMMQFNMYHHYTVDDHLIRAVGFLASLDQGELSEEHPLSNRLMKHVNRRVIYCAVLLHDIAKGREEDHSIAGCVIAKEICPRFGLGKSEADIVAWLVEHHLDMSTYAQSRDISDRRTLMDFANIVQTRARLDLLLILTVVDIKAVGPDTWNGWKGQLLRNLYYAVETYLSGSVPTHSIIKRVEQEKKKLAESLKREGWEQEAIERAINRHLKPYWLKTPLQQQVEHAKLIEAAKDTEETLYTNVAINSFTDSTEITIYRVNHPFHLMTITAACASVGTDISGAQISTTKDDMALDVITLQRSFERDEDEMRRADNIIRLMHQIISGEKSLEDIQKSMPVAKGRISAFRVEPQVTIDNTISERFTVIEIEGLNRSGLLFDISSTMSALNINIHSAHIATFGEKIVDVFYVTDLTSTKIMDEERIEKSQASLLEAISEVENGDK